MRVWLPYVRAGSGADLFVERLRDALRAQGVDALASPFPHWLQYAPWALRAAAPPAGTRAILANAWNAFAFRRPGLPLAAVEFHCIFDPANVRLRSPAQALFHEGLVRRCELASLRAADAVVAISDYTRQSLLDALGVAATDRVLPAIDTAFFCPAAGSQPGSGARPGSDRGAAGPARLLFVGNLSTRKGADLLPAILDRLGGRATLAYTSGLRGGNALRGLPNARPLGHLSAGALREAYRAADLLLFPSRLEGFGYAAAEALACGTPVVATDGSSLPEVVRHGQTGLLCPPDDADAFAAAVLRLIGNPGELAAMGRTGRADAVSRFDPARMARDYIAIFERLVSAPPPLNPSRAPGDTRPDRPRRSAPR